MASAGGIRILVVDDRQDVVDNLVRVFTADGLGEVVGSANTGADAVRLAEELEPDVVVMDFSMEDMDGLEASCRIQQTLPETRIVILSVHEPSARESTGDLSCIERWVSKSASLDVLLNAIREAAATAEVGAPHVKEA